MSHPAWPSLVWQTEIVHKGDKWHLSTVLRNASAHPALMVRLKVVREKSGDRILPVLFSDNYVALMPGESRTITIEIANADTHGEKPRFEISGFNVVTDTAEVAAMQ